MMSCHPVGCTTMKVYVYGQIHNPSLRGQAIGHAIAERSSDTCQPRRLSFRHVVSHVRRRLRYKDLGTAFGFSWRPRNIWKPRRKRSRALNQEEAQQMGVMTMVESDRYRSNLYDPVLVSCALLVRFFGWSTSSALGSCLVFPCRLVP